MAPEYRAMSVTAQDCPALFDRLSRWSATRSPELVVASVTTATATGGAGVTALVVYADRGHGSVTELAVSELASVGTAADLVAEYYRNQLSAGVAPDKISPQDAVEYAASRGLRCSRQAASKKIGKLRAEGAAQ